MAKALSTALVDGLRTSFDIGSRKRQSVVIGDLLDGGDTNCVELPAHDSPDRGNPIKIGGYASDVVPTNTPVNVGDRVNAWCTLNGQLTTRAEVDGSYVIDAGVRRQVLFASVIYSHNNNATTIIAGSAGIRHKVLACAMQPMSLATSGIVVLSDSVSLSYYAGYFANIGSNLWRTGQGMVIFQTAVGNPLNGLYTANCQVAWSVTYYDAP